MSARAVLCVVALIVVMATANAADTLRITVSTSIGCKSKDDLDLAVGIVKGNDFPAFSKILNTGRCTLFYYGDEVTMVEQAVFSGMYRVRPRGSTNTYWMMIDHAK